MAFLRVLLFSLLLMVGLQAQETVCLNMIAENNAATIKQSLESVKPFISYWVVVDIGSTDDTIRIVRECLKTIPGEIHTMKWKGMEETYNAALQLAKNKANYVLMMSGEAHFEYDVSFSLPTLSDDVYCIFWQDASMSGLRRQLIKASLPWRWKVGDHGSVDYLSCDVPCSSSVLEGIRYVIQDRGREARTTENVCPLQKKGDDRVQSLEWCRSRLSSSQNEQEKFELLLRIANIQKDLSYPFDDIVDSYYAAYRCCPYRIEPVYMLAHLYNKQKEYLLAYETIKSWSYIKHPERKIESHCAEYGVLLELSIASFYLGKYEESLSVCTTLLGLSSLPGEIRNRVLINKNVAVQKLADRGS